MTLREIYREFKKLSDTEQISILFTALEIMQQYNGRSTNVCIALAMKYEEVDTDDWIKINQDDMV